MQNIMLLYNPLSDSGTFSGGSWQAGLPLANLADRKLYRVARSIDADPAHTQFRVALNTMATFKALVLGPANFTTAYQYRIRCFNNSDFDEGDADSSAYGFSGLMYDSGWVKPFEGTGGGPLDREWEDPWFWLGIEPFDDPERGISLIHILPSPIVDTMYWSFEIDDQYNPAGYVQMSRLFMPEVWQPSRNYSYEGSGLTFRDNSLSSTTLSGSTLKWRRVNPRQFQFALQYLDESEAFASAYRVMQVAGYDGEVFVIMDPDDTANIQKRAMFSRITQMTPIQQAAVALAGTGYQVEEII